MKMEMEREMQNLDHIRFVTRHFHDLQGLRYLVPLGLMILSGGLTFASGWPWMLLRAALFLGGCLLLLGAKRYYGSTYGEVEQAVVPPVAEPVAVSILGQSGSPSLSPWTGVVPIVLLVSWLAVSVFAVFQILFWPPWVDSHLPFLFQSIYALCGSLLLALWWSRRRPLTESYDLGIGILLSGFAILGPWFVPEAIELPVALLLCGASMIAVGCLDHWQLVRVLGGPTQDLQEGE